jgi:hypothetical protein
MEPTLSEGSIAEHSGSSDKEDGSRHGSAPSDMTLRVAFVNLGALGTVTRSTHGRILAGTLGFK